MYQKGRGIIIDLLDRHAGATAGMRVGLVDPVYEWLLESNDYQAAVDHG